MNGNRLNIIPISACGTKSQRGPWRTTVHTCVVAILSTTLVLCLFATFGCSSNGSEAQPSNTAATSEQRPGVAETQDSDNAPKSSTGKAPSTPEELQMASAAAAALSVPYNGNVICTIGEPFYSENLGMTVRSVSFYEGGKLCAGADCSEDGTPVANFVYY